MILFQKFKETFFSVLPIMAVVFLLSAFLLHLDSMVLLRFSAGGVLVVVGLTEFLLGVDIGIIPIGEQIGAKLTQKRNLVVLLCVSFFIGFLVTVAEPDVQVLALQIKSVCPGIGKWKLVFSISLGLGLFMVLGLFRSVVSIKLRYVLLFSYIALFVAALMCPADLQGAAFDAGGATTGPMTVPFILALGMGVANVRTASGGDSESSRFGLTGISSIGPVMAVCIYGIIISGCGSGAGGTGSLDSAAEGAVSDKGLLLFLHILPGITKDVLMAFLPLCAMFLVFQVTLLKMPPFLAGQMAKGLVYSLVGLILFMVGVNGGFMDAGRELGRILAAKSASGGWWVFLILAVSFAFGAITVCAEPAVKILTEQVEEVSGGNIKQKVLLWSLSIGVGLSVMLSMLKIIFGFSIWWILIPGYSVALAMMFFCPPLFTGIAFDSGGVASGPMTSTFILSFALGASSVLGEGGNGAFGVIALVAMTPLIAIQILGIIYKYKTGGIRK